MAVCIFRSPTVIVFQPILRFKMRITALLLGSMSFVVLFSQLDAGTIRELSIISPACYLKLYQKRDLQGKYEEIRVNSTEWTTLNRAGVNTLPQNHKLFKNYILLPDLILPQQESGHMTLETRRTKFFFGGLNSQFFPTFEKS